MNLRGLACKLMIEVLDTHRSLNDVLPEYQSRCKNKEDKALLQAMIFGVLRFYPRLEFMANQLLKKPFKAKDQAILYLICLGIYQLTELRVPDYAAISETVEAARTLKKPWAVGVINASLREFQRRKEAILTQAKNNKEVWAAHPLWLRQRIQQDWPKDASAIFEANNTLPPLVLRINQRKIDRKDFLALLEQSQIQKEAPLLKIIAPVFPPSAVILTTPTEITELPGYKEGFFSVQDAASQCAAFLLDLHSDEKLRILDACAAPGGKTTHILERAKNCELWAIDIAKARTDKIKENLQRLNLSATVITEDIKKFAKDFKSRKQAPFDRILLDAPCSAIGVIRRHPDIKYLRVESDIATLAAQQYDLLESLWPLLTLNGLLLYATCSILKEENDEVIRKFMQAHSDAVLISTPCLLEAMSEKTLDNHPTPPHVSAPQEGPLGISTEMALQILPGQNDMDGFYYARIRKKNK